MATSPQLSSPDAHVADVDSASPNIEDPETEPGTFAGELPGDLEEFAAPPRDEP